ncbi:AAA family ATPase [Desulfurobacterium atlanticum]|uniref:MoxR-like ATPase n=1 Tax=Desulfurobacterium atlanticum TaxID=240169 RepID=A0A238ZXD5_9BACT|nr:MoxR family ATPase [Desulfurobacterium atlanticum]SNR87980.1 MoxR-like ATPase [Desulfurobacterium atlanticum]
MVQDKLNLCIKVLGKYIKGKETVIRTAFLTILSEGHLLVEDIPGVGKTTLALGIAKILNLSFGRIQCTSDLMPSDITGVSIFNQKTKEFEFKKGPVFNNIVLIDEINRAMPKTQSALLEAMEERQVTVDGKTYKLPEPFFVIATQNPLEQIGAFPLPESQLDRFTAKTAIGYPDRESEIAIVIGKDTREEIETLSPILSKEELLEGVKKTKAIYMSEKIGKYIVDIGWKTRNSKFLESGLSVRGTLTLGKMARANAFLKGRDYVIPEDVLEVALYVIPHRVVPKEEYSSIPREEVIKSILSEVEPPV